jgi:hypothetical protein
MVRIDFFLITILSGTQKKVERLFGKFLAGGGGNIKHGKFNTTLTHFELKRNFNSIQFEGTFNKRFS